MICLLSNLSSACDWFSYSSILSFKDFERVVFIAAVFYGNKTGTICGRFGGSSGTIKMSSLSSLSLTDVLRLF